MTRPFFHEIGRELVHSGIGPSLYEREIPLWDEALNVIEKNGGIGHMPGWKQALTKPASNAVRGMIQQRQTDLTQHLLWGDDADLYEWNGATVTTRSKGASPYSNGGNSWSFELFGNFVVATNDVDTPQIWKPNSAANFADMTGLTFTKAKLFTKRGPHLIAMNTSNGFNWVEWADEDAPETWSPTSSNLAGNLDIRELEGEIKATDFLGNQVSIYGPDSLHVMSYVGGNLVFGIQPAIPSGIGAVGPQSVVSVGPLNYGVSRQGVWQTDGNDYSYIDDPFLKEYLQENVNWDEAEKIVALHMEDESSIYFWFPIGASTEPDEGWVFNYGLGRWTSKLDFGRNAAVPRQVFKHPYAATDSGDIFQHQNGQDADGSALTCRLRTKPLVLDDKRVWKMVKKLRPLVRDVAGSPQVRVGSQEDLSKAVSWSAWQNLDETEDPLFFRKSGPYVRVEFESSGTGEDWTVAGFSIEGRLTGRALR